MSKYQGIVRIMDVVGTRFERALTQDEIVEILLGASPTVATNAGSSEVAPKAEKRHYKKRGEKVVKKNSTKGGVKHECCGSLGKSHKKGCPMSGRTAGTSKNARMVASRKTAFSNGTWSSVKNALDGGELVSMVVRDKGLDEDEVRRVNISDSYEEYLTIA